MAKLISAEIDINPVVKLQLTEEELHALDAIFGYNIDHFLKAFYEKMGKAYVQPYENGVRSLHATVRSAVSGPLMAIQESRRILRAAKINLP